MSAPPNSTLPAKPGLDSELLLANGFTVEGRWIVGGFGSLQLDPSPSRGPGVYAFAVNGAVKYVGVATVCMVQRLNFYGRPGKSQSTNIRIKQLLLTELSSQAELDILVARPEKGLWRSLPVDMCAGLEVGLVKAFFLPWNIKGI